MLFGTKFFKSRSQISKYAFYLSYQNEQIAAQAAADMVLTSHEASEIVAL